MGDASYSKNDQQAPKQQPQSAERPDPKATGQTPKATQDRRRPAGADLPAAGPHAKPELMNDEGTPGAGTLPEAGRRDATDSTSG
ncbi:hypothetical protein [Microvirga puerhi]|uniref:Uncharacterized protein n=1 Tax=Microvirga puerhi TaxID=2876078 RepID=A0ABS7VQZ0_9HYPH|nr:hypothetical protein [Microvirga puerhi]MBZ6077475.1 hypothetical protein [Microvirga puerhi]